MAWNQPSASNHKQTNKRRRSVRWLTILSPLFILFGLILMFFAFDNQTHVQVDSSRERKLIKSVTPARQVTLPSVVTARMEKVVKLPDGRPSVPLSKMTKEQRIEWITQARIEDAIAHGRTNEHGEAVLYKTPFESSTEESLAQIFSLELGDVPPAIFPVMPEIDGKNLERLIVQLGMPSDGDTPELAELRQNLKQVKKMLAEYIADGGNAEDFIGYYRGELETCARMRQDADRMLKEMCMSNDDPEVLRAFYEASNQKLAEKGIKPLALTPKMKELMQLTE